MRLRWFEYLFVLFLALNGFILAQRLYYLVDGRDEGELLLMRTFSALVVSAAIIIYFVIRYRRRQS